MTSFPQQALAQLVTGAVILWLAIVSAGCSPAITPPTHTPRPPTQAKTSEHSETNLESLLRLIRQRLEIMPGVAQAKWNRKLPITDARRESALLDKMAAEGATLGLPEDVVRQFFQAQISAAKLVQEQLIQDWDARKQPSFAKALDLERDVRPQIDRLNQELLAALAKCQIEKSDEGWKNKLDQAKSAIFPDTEWSQGVVDKALLPLYEIAGQQSAGKK